ncbi:thioredoxin-like protein [Conidiobolus coronatus NRRL 28638]|uniref:Thioredoxin-like protein n=1 Tax=Conidiobolus coronatus (strain ATCC 28846 / CBS 209.66 / NRRL 28638) TaxID=796925 RepID=A0A137P7B4_CONC2|nr:thioredoxin-like protein [Conidiobolus coronatus NRRL 28638]|eukprot:KXN70903.1 thioredoxin-like protein [Conidiobolus coronatus NRRL 28638]
MKLTSYLKLTALASLISANNIELDDTNLLDSIQSGTWFVKYYIDSCKWCKKLAPIWEEVSTDLTRWSGKNNFKLASFSCSKYYHLCSKLEIEGYPTLYLYKDGKFIEEYNGPRGNKDLKSYVKDQAQKLKRV